MKALFTKRLSGMRDNIVQKILKVMPMLSSSNDCEVLGAVNAMKRILKAEGKDIYDLCSLLSNSTDSGSDTTKNTKTNTNKGYDFNSARNRSNQANSANKIRIERILESEFALSDWETSFLESVAEQMGEGRTLSAKQKECLDKIYAKAVIDD